MQKAAYLSLNARERADRAQSLRQLMQSCTICPVNCRVNRIDGDLGACRTGPDPSVASYGPHYGEEPPLVGRNGSGTIFFTGCNLHCSFCQNYEISQLNRGQTLDTNELAWIMLSLQHQGSHNINLVSPTHQIPAIIESLNMAIPQGLNLPIVYNSGGYDSVDTLRLLDGIIDIYMPDMKYSDNVNGFRYSGVVDYWDRNREAVREMHRQVGDLQIVKSPSDRELAVRGLLIRHLVLPGGLAGTEGIADFIANEISRDTYVNIMQQYRPCHKAVGHPQIGRPITQVEYSSAIEQARAAGLWRFVC